jgi:Cu+-exporting ATPase
MQVKDPVCGMTLEDTDAAVTLEREGTTYYFCSQDCADEFQTNPEDYT